ncbi:MAG: YdiU family protein [Rhodospirillaceae bacterium]|nr:MAG: YdiU family protein [Rhodospirillaceae bacterium]
MQSLTFDNAFIRDLPGDRETGPRQRQVAGALYSRVEATPVKAPRLLAYAPEVAKLLGLSAADVTVPDFAEVFAGNKLWPGMEPYAANYGGHQFGNWAGQLGDGRAINLGEIVNGAGERWEIQLKGAGLTPYSRHADGRAVLRSSIREFLCSEAMHHLGVPTTRALCLVATGEEVVRDMFYDGRPRAEQGAIVCRVAPSFIRFGNFELPAARGDTALLKQLADFTIRRDFPHLAKGKAELDREVYQAWFAEICDRTATMIGHWMRVGFVHGVMNTDNMSILGLTIDYGPYGWVDNFDPDWTPNTTDKHTRRYRFGQQASVAYWNLTRLAGALISLFDDAVEPLQAGLQVYADRYMAAEEEIITSKLGLRQFAEEDRALMMALQEWLSDTEVDMTLFFRALADLDLAKPDLAGDNLRLMEPAFYDDEKRQQGTAAFNDWLARYAKRVAQDALPTAERRARMNAVNPRYVLRNYLAQQAIDRAEQGDAGGIQDLMEVMRNPYEDQPGREAFAERRPDWARNRAGCSMLSCSS